MNYSLISCAIVPSHIITASGRKVDLLDPKPDDIDIKDIAHHLSQINRFTGAALYPVSVAAHSILVSELCSPENRLQGLLHDATEAYLGDVSTPLKELLPEYRRIESLIRYAIADAFCIKPEIPEEVKMADRAAFFLEWDHAMPDVPHGLPGFRGLAWESMIEKGRKIMSQVLFQYWVRLGTSLFFKKYDEAAEMSRRLVDGSGRKLLAATP